MAAYQNPRTPKLSIDPAAIAARFHSVAEAKSTEELHAALLDSVSDVPLLLDEVDRLWTLLLRTRLEYANLRAAAQAALSAAHEDEPDPLAYLTDELTGAWQSGPSIVDAR